MFRFDCTARPLLLKASEFSARNVSKFNFRKVDCNWHCHLAPSSCVSGSTDVFVTAFWTLPSPHVPSLAPIFDSRPQIYVVVLSRSHLEKSKKDICGQGETRISPWPNRIIKINNNLHTLQLEVLQSGIPSHTANNILRLPAHHQVSFSNHHNSSIPRVKAAGMVPRNTENILTGTGCTKSLNDSSPKRSGTISQC